ncbi:MAG: bifunctional nuclease family protein [Desulfovibrio sp.]|nr:bifunctional nuclease family protein [Desulfovibrio sp.]
MISMRYAGTTRFLKKRYLLLREKFGDTILPLELSAWEALTVTLLLHGTSGEGIVLDAYEESLACLHGHVSAVVAADWVEGRLQARVHLESPEGLFPVEAPLAFAVALAVRQKLPLLASEEIVASLVLKQQSLFEAIQRLSDRNEPMNADAFLACAAPLGLVGVPRAAWDEVERFLSQGALPDSVPAPAAGAEAGLEDLSQIEPLVSKPM